MLGDLVKEEACGQSAVIAETALNMFLVGDPRADLCSKSVLCTFAVLSRGEVSQDEVPFPIHEMQEYTKPAVMAFQ